MNSWLSLHLIANQLGDIHYALSQKILNAPRHKPRWKVSELTITDPDTGESKKHEEIEELEALKILIGSLKTLAQQDYSLAFQAATPPQKPSQE